MKTSSICFATLALLALVGCPGGTVGNPNAADAGGLFDATTTATDLAFADGGGTAAAKDKVNCGAAICDVAASEHCCAAMGNASCSKAACAAMSLTFICDGPEDCGANHACCLNLAAPDAEPAQCSKTTTVDKDCANGPNLCHTSNDCPPTAPRCCFNVVQQVPASIGTCLDKNCM